MLEGVQDAGINYTLTMPLLQVPDLFHGASIKVSDDITLDDILSVPGVLNVFPVRKYALPAPVDPSRPGSAAADSRARAGVLVKREYDPFEAQADAMFDDYEPGSNEGATLDKRATTAKKNAYATDNFSPHKMTGVDKMHKAGYLGKGVRIAVVDTGVDYKNPILGGW